MITKETFTFHISNFVSIIIFLKGRIVAPPGGGIQLHAGSRGGQIQADQTQLQR